MLYFVVVGNLLHHCHVVSIRGNSYRMRHHTDLYPGFTGTHDAEDPQPRRRQSRREQPTS
jgi:hypothetical protein